MKGFRSLAGFLMLMPALVWASIEVPKIDEMSLHDARKVLLTGGWKPVRQETAVEPFGQMSEFRTLGYEEVESCSAGAVFCSFRYVDDEGRKLQVVSSGEEGKGADGEIYLARIDNYTLTDLQGVSHVLKKAPAMIAEEKKEAIWKEITERLENEVTQWCSAIGNQYRLVAEVRDQGTTPDQFIELIRRKSGGVIDEKGATAVLYAERVYNQFAYYKPAEVAILTEQECRNNNKDDYLKKAEAEYEKAIEGL